MLTMARRLIGAVARVVRRRPTGRRYGVYDQKPPAYTGPALIGKRLTAEPDKTGPDWIGKPLPVHPGR